MRTALAILAVAAVVLGGIGFGVWKFYSATSAEAAAALPSTVVKRSDVRMLVAAKGEVQGGKPEMLTAPMSSRSELAITFLRTSGDLVKPGDIVAEFDKTDEVFALREAEADLAEAEQQLAQAEAESRARQEEARYALIQAQADVEIAELEERKNPIVSAIAARQATLAVEAARDKLRQLSTDIANRKTTGQAAIAIQQAARNKAMVKAETARKNIEQMTLRAKSSGYVAIQANTWADFNWGMQVPPYQVGDTIRSGMAVAMIPDLEDWEVSATIGELDRGHLAVGQMAEVTTVAAAGHKFHAKIKTIGGTTGPVWDRKFEARLSLLDPSPELRPGITVRVRITTGTLPNALWVPSQALFESDGRTFVYLRGAGGFKPLDVTLIQRSDSQVVIEGLQEGQVVALASPEQLGTTRRGAASAVRALPKP